jgi:hypothetical protein
MRSKQAEQLFAILFRQGVEGTRQGIGSGAYGITYLTDFGQGSSIDFSLSE